MRESKVPFTRPFPPQSTFQAAMTIGLRGLVPLVLPLFIALLNGAKTCPQCVPTEVNEEV